MAAPGSRIVSRRASDDRAFTLLELLVVMLVIAVLSSLAVPAAAGARTRAQDGAVRANLRTALVAAMAARVDSGTWPDATNLGAMEPALDYVPATAVSTGPRRVSVYPEPDGFTAAALAATGRCHLVSVIGDAPPQWTTRSGRCAAFYGTNGVVTTLAGSTSGYVDAVGTAARFTNPWGVAVGSDDVVYVADSGNHRIRRIAPDGTVTTLAGSTQGFADGVGAAARFDGPAGIALDQAGNLYVTDYWNHRIRKVAPDGTVSTLAGGGTGGSTDGPASVARFSQPHGVAVDRTGVVYVADFGNHRIRRIAPDGTVSTLAGSTAGFADGVGAAARFFNPTDVAVDADGIVYVTDYANHRIRRITPDGTVTTLAGSTQGFADGVGAAARFNLPYGIAVDELGRLYVADFNNHRIRRITPDGTVTTVAGSTAGSADGVGTAAQFNLPLRVAVAPTGALVVSDFGNHRIRRID